MSRKNITIFMVCVFSAVSIMSAGYAFSQTSQSVTEEELGIRTKSLYSEEKVQPFKGEYSDKAPGESIRLERAFENSPPLIPHDLTGMLPIAESNNICESCHMPEVAKGLGAIPLPKTHFMDMKTGEDLGGKLDGKRYNCMQCHVPQVKLPTPVKNIFEGDFRDEKSKYNSNLADILNEGVAVE
jgi:cytochrome c-type protein NapB